MLQQGAMALTSFHGKLSQPLKHAQVPPVHSSGFPVLSVLSHCLGLVLAEAAAFATATHFPRVYILVDAFISN